MEKEAYLIAFLKMATFCSSIKLHTRLVTKKNLSMVLKDP